MGQKTIFSAQDAGQAMLELAKGGLTAADIRAGALNETLRLAAAGGIDLASSASVIANGLNMFGLRADQAKQVTVALAGAANASTASVDSLRMALSQVGPGARTAGLSIQETVAALAEFDNAGIKGSDAGTSLKTMLQRLVPQTTKAAMAMDHYNLTFKDSSGNFLSLAQIAENLRKHLGNLSAVQKTQALNTIFGSDASRAAAILMRGGAKQVEAYTKAAKDQAATQKMANVAMKGASGAWENFKGTIETTAISLGQKALPAVEDMLNKGNEFLTSADEWGPGVASDFKMVVDAAKAASTVIKPLAELAVGLAKGFQSLPGPIKETAVAVGIATVVWPKLQAAAVGALTPIGDQPDDHLGMKLSQFRAEMTYSATRAQALQGAMRSAAGPAGMGLLIASASTGNEKLKTLGQVGGAALLGFGRLARSAARSQAARRLSGSSRSTCTRPPRRRRRPRPTIPGWLGPSTSSLVR
jgi:TP901 family phage tail tape measure protein